MTLDLNDPRLSAYALGELDEYELATVERELLHSESARQAVEEIRQMAGILREELKSEPQPLLHESQKSAIERQLRTRTDSGSRTASRGFYVDGALLAAASLCIVIYLGCSHRRTRLQGAFDTDRNGRVIGPRGPIVVPTVQVSPNQSSDSSRDAHATPNDTSMSSTENRV